MVISPATTTRPVVTRVSQATRLMRVLGQDGVEDRVGDLVGHLVGMALGHRLRGEGPAGSRVLLVGGSGSVGARCGPLVVGRQECRRCERHDGIEHALGHGPLVGQRDILVPPPSAP